MSITWDQDGYRTQLNVINGELPFSPIRWLNLVVLTIQTVQTTLSVFKGHKEGSPTTLSLVVKFSLFRS